MVVETSAPELTGLTISEQRWENLTFLHWPVEPAAGRRSCCRRGSFRTRSRARAMSDWCRSRCVEPARDAACRFRTSETSARPTSGSTRSMARAATASSSARWMRSGWPRCCWPDGASGLPYAWSKMSAVHAGDLWRYRTSRRWPRADLGSEITVRVGDPVEPTDLEVWLTSRWGLHTRVAGRTVWVPNQHGPWPLRVRRIDRDAGRSGCRSGRSGRRAHAPAAVLAGRPHHLRSAQPQCGNDASSSEQRQVRTAPDPRCRWRPRSVTPPASVSPEPADLATARTAGTSSAAPAPSPSRSDHAVSGSRPSRSSSLRWLRSGESDVTTT